MSSSSLLSSVIIIVVLIFLTLFAFDNQKDQRDQNDVFKVSELINDEDSALRSLCCGDIGYDNYGNYLVCKEQKENQRDKIEKALQEYQQREFLSCFWWMSTPQSSRCINNWHMTQRYLSVIVTSLSVTEISHLGGFVLIHGSHLGIHDLDQLTVLYNGLACRIESHTSKEVVIFTPSAPINIHGYKIHMEYHNVEEIISLYYQVPFLLPAVDINVNYSNQSDE